VILSRSDAASTQQREAIRSRVLSVDPRVIWAESVHRPSKLLSWPDAVASHQSVQSQPVAVLSAIGNPAAFVQTVEKCGARVVDALMLPDHDPYDQQTMIRLRSWVSSLGDSISGVICTHKDLVKLQTDRIAGRPLAALLIEIELQVGKEAVESAIVAAAQTSPSAS
jgi:tetraacyldisaccharide 4'-kinase